MVVLVACGDSAALPMPMVPRPKSGRQQTIGNDPHRDGQQEDQESGGYRGSARTWCGRGWSRPVRGLSADSSCSPLRDASCRCHRCGGSLWLNRRVIGVGFSSGAATRTSAPKVSDSRHASQPGRRPLKLKPPQSKGLRRIGTRNRVRCVPRPGNSCRKTRAGAAHVDNRTVAKVFHGARLRA